MERLRPRSCLTMSARISDTVCCCRTAALYAIIIQMSFLSADIGKSTSSVIAAPSIDHQFLIKSSEGLYCALSTVKPNIVRQRRTTCLSDDDVLCTAHGGQAQTSTRSKIRTLPNDTAAKLVPGAPSITWLLGPLALKCSAGKKSGHFAVLRYHMSCFLQKGGTQPFRFKENIPVTAWTMAVTAEKQDVRDNYFHLCPRFQKKPGHHPVKKRIQSRFPFRHLARHIMNRPFIVYI